MATPKDDGFTARSLLALREDVATQSETAERIRIMFNAIAEQHGVRPVDAVDAKSI